MNFKRFDSSEGNVWKYVFEAENAVAEAVLYQYESFQKRTVICCSVQSGCPVGCVFCGTGKRFIRNLSADEICEQIAIVLNDMNIDPTLSEKFQIMFMSMGEPFLNMVEVSAAITRLHQLYRNADLLVSTVGIDKRESWEKFMILSQDIPKIGLQFSLHSGLDDVRNNIIPFGNKFSIRGLRDMGIKWHALTGRRVYLNYCVTGQNAAIAETDRIQDLFSPAVFNMTFSVLCSSDDNMKSASFRNHEVIQEVMSRFTSEGYNVRMFDPAGQDDIGGGCGQLWYVQDWMKNHGR